MEFEEKVRLMDEALKVNQEFREKFSEYVAGGRGTNDAYNYFGLEDFAPELVVKPVEVLKPVVKPVAKPAEQKV